MAGSIIRTDASQLRSLGTRLRKTRPTVYRAIRREILRQAKQVADDAKQKADWSSRIPGTIKASAAGVNTAKVRAGGAAAPHAAAYEHGGAEGTFRHPVFADQSKTRDEWTWVNQEARPFLHPALMDHYPELVEGLASAVETAVGDAIDGRL